MRFLVRLFLLILSLEIVIVYLFFLRPPHREPAREFRTLLPNVKFIRYECVMSRCGGWADRLKAICSAYALSLLLKRRFLIRISQPCTMNSVLRPNKIAWDEILEPELLARQGSVRLLEFRHNLSTLGLFRDQNLFEEFKNDDLVIIRSGLNFLDSLAENRHLQERIRQLGYEPARFKLHYLLREFYHELFKLNDRLQAKYEAILKTLRPSVRTRVICAQVRIGDRVGRTFTERNRTLEFWRFIESNWIAKEPDYKLYVTSDREEVKEEAAEFFGKENLVSLKNSSVHISRDVSDLNGDCKPIENAILDFHLLQNCDSAVVSHSGFGLLGAWNRPAPSKDLYVHTNQNSIKKDYWDRRNLAFVKLDDLDSFYFI